MTAEVFESESSVVFDEAELWGAQAQRRRAWSAKIRKFSSKIGAAMAIEDGYVLAAAQGGTHSNGRRTWGHSMLVDPWGEIKAVLPEGEGVIVGEIDQDLIVRVRENLPALKHRRL